MDKMVEENEANKKTAACKTRSDNQNKTINYSLAVEKNTSLVR